jgi:hypothetical protein
MNAVRLQDLHRTKNLGNMFFITMELRPKEAYGKNHGTKNLGNMFFISMEL